jgi:Bifunctional DNA primase/polymerase, N-terminal
MVDTLAQARRLRALELSVIPVPRPRPGVPVGQPGDGKVPLVAWKEFQTRLPTDDEITRLFSGAPMNLAIVTGAISDVVVIDADDPQALRWCTTHLPYTPRQTQTSKGFHLWYRHPGVHVPNRARIATRDGRLAIDVRGDGGYVIAPGSMHASGTTYREAGDWTVPREQLPRFWPGWLQRPQRQSPINNLPRPIGNVIDRARRYLAAIPPPVIGYGSDNATLYAACRLVRGFGLTTSDAEALLLAWAGGRPGWTRAWIVAKVQHAEKYGSEPIGALR